jgi:hypothetical protein
MASSFRVRQGGYLLIAVVAFLFAIGATVLLSQTGMILSSKSGAFSRTQNSITKINDALIAFVTVYRRLPCPANPALAESAANAGYPDGNTLLSTAIVTCAYPNGVVPWRALGLKADDVTDEWGRLVSYRVYDGLRGFTQAGGVSAVDCDLTNGSTTETPPDPTTGLCDPDHNTLAASFFAYPVAAPAYTKGLSVLDFGVLKTGLAYLLTSHGPSGLGGYTAAGTQVAPNASTGDYPNTQTAATFRRDAFSAPDLAVGSAGHYDDIVDFVTIVDLQVKTKLGAREWSEMPGFTAGTTANMTSASTDPLNPHFMTTGVGGSGQEFVAVSSGGETLVSFGGNGSSSGYSYAGCLWWPLRLNLATATSRQLVASYVEFSVGTNIPGFTMGFLGGGSLTSPVSPPSNNICGTTVALNTTASGASGDSTITVASTAGIEVGMNVSGVGIAQGALVLGVSGATVTLDRANTGAVGPKVDFTNSNLIRRDLGWAGGTVAAYNPNRFAVEFDIYPDTGVLTPMVVASAADPSRPHLAVDFTGVTHGTDAESCTDIGNGKPCDSEVADFAAVTKTATGALGSSTITVTDAAGVTGIVHGMQVAGVGIGAGAVVTGLAGNIVTLSAANDAIVSGGVTFFSISTSGFMQNGPTIFHGMRTEISPRDCVAPTSTGGALGSTTVTVADASRIAAGMNVYGTGIASGAVVTGIAGTTLTLSNANTAAVIGTLVLGGWVSPDTAATGFNGLATIVVDNAAGIFIGDTVSGAGIAAGAAVTGITGTTISLSQPNTGAVSGPIVFTQTLPPARTFVKAWTLSNAGCNASPSNCAAMQNVNARFSANISADRQFMHSVSCIRVPSVTDIYNTLYFGLTTASQTLLPATDSGILFRRLNVSDGTTIP